MQRIPDELAKVFSERLKLGENARPVCRVEVDRLAFIPGRMQEISFLLSNGATQEQAERIYIDESKGGGEMSSSPYSIIFPVEGKSEDDITSKFGVRTHPVTGEKGKQHNGVDIGCGVGTKIRAAWSGVVTRINSNASNDLGLYVDVRHEGNLTTRYGHLNKIDVKLNDVVTQGEYLGDSGKTGKVTGPHLHFAMLDSGSKFIDPYHYLTGTKKLFGNAQASGSGIIREELPQGHEGEWLFQERFRSRDWLNDKSRIVDYDKPLRELGVIQWVNGDSVYRLNADKPIKAGFSFQVSPREAGSLELSMAGTEGLGEVRLYSGSRLLFKFSQFKGIDRFEQFKRIMLPAGSGTIRFEASFQRNAKHALALDYIQVREWVTSPEPGNVGFVDPTQPSGLNGERLTGTLFNEGLKSSSKLHVGEFVYMDTLVLEGVTSVDIDDQFEMDSREARITISNPDGFYSPDSNPYYFPENFMETPWNYFINGHHYGVLSENAPIRIYMGYGMNMVRVFTGLIDKIDSGSDSPMLTISARDMYKKVLNKVLTEDKEYGTPAQSEHTDIGGSAADGILSPLNRRQQIISKAKYWAKTTNPKLDYVFLLAIATHETAMGTKGAGRESSGSWILGYDVHPNGYRAQYKGIDNQLKYGAKRYNEAMKSKNWEFKSLADVEYFWKGGDKGVYQWAADKNWPNSVYAVYKNLQQNPPADFASTPIWLSDSADAQPPAQNAPAKPASWLKSSIVNDLIVHAGLSGWRQSPSDIGYPDYIIEETYLIERDAKNGKMIKAVPGKEGEFEEVPYDSTLTPQGWLNPFVDQPRNWRAFEHRISDCINEVIGDTNYRTYCDRYGTFHLEQINLNKPVSASFTEYDNLVSINKTVDYTRARSHVVMIEGNNAEHFLDPELLMELKGELRSTVMNLPYVKTKEEKKQIAERFFWDLKRLCRTLQISIPGNPALDVLDRIYISDRRTTTRSTYLIKGIKTSFSSENGYLQVIDLTWGGEGNML
ncbi:peptidoglycan DD-metalloendopeptidase family protein [Paenibacillus sp. NPDC058071]|uniref:peptidoglycan DD-metalloendopeptidase family protein n=1 Tax=Paenibacillus sp. NPDC058071 TaxID=3346326 RepID=UPI0036D92D0D